MERHFDEELQQLRKDILSMATLAEEAIRKSIAALENRDQALARRVLDEDDRIDELELQIDEKCIDLIARHQPMARDLRFLATALKINAELERIADLAVDVAQRILELDALPVLKPLIDIPALAVVSQRMVREAIDAFVQQNVELAGRVVREDTEADRLRDNVQRELVNDYMARDPSTANRAVPLLLISRHLERICDHATNIAEDVIYMVQGQMVKHHPEKLPGG